VTGGRTSGVAPRTWDGSLGPRPEVRHPTADVECSGMPEQPNIQIDSDISRAWSVPAPFYTDPVVFALENERVFECPLRSPI
jgi:hypothetical protein